MKEIEVKNLFISDIKDTQTIFNGYTEFDSRYREDTYQILFEDPNLNFEIGKQYIISIEYSAKISTGKDGIYAGLDPRFMKTHNLSLSDLYKIEDETLKDKLIENMTICVQCEPAYARQVLPCFDEPCKKATFKCRVLVQNKAHIALSNTEGKEVIDDKGRWFQFSESPKMCTYLICIVIGKFDYFELKTKRGIKVRGYTPEGQSNQVREHIEIAVEAVDLYEEYFGIPYPLEKLDLVSFHSHMVRAMENWGIITIKNLVILNHPEFTSSYTVQRNSRTVAHEVSHMWFGNLVSPEWWDVIWLNEGFARYAEHQILNKIRPGFRIWDKYMFEVYASAINKDKTLYRTHPVHVEVPGPNQLMSIFDEISYAKGSAICRMLNGIIGDEQLFQNALKTYMTKFQGQCAVTEDLIECFEQTSGKPIKQLIMPWINQACFPELHITRISQNEFEITQTCFQGQSNSIWPIYISYISASGIEGSITMLDQDIELKIENLNQDDIVKFNYGHQGFYICIYDEEYSQQLIQLNHKFNSFDRFGILFDLVQTKSSIDVKDLVHFKGETSIGTWNLLYEQLDKIASNYLKNPETYQKDFEVIQDIVKFNFNQILNSTEIDYQLLNMHLFFLGVGCHDNQVIKYCVEEMKTKISKETWKCSIDIDIRLPVYMISCFYDQDCAEILRKYFEAKKQFFIEQGIDSELSNLMMALALSPNLQHQDDINLNTITITQIDKLLHYIRLLLLSFHSVTRSLTEDQLVSPQFQSYLKIRARIIYRYYSYTPLVDSEMSKDLLKLFDKLGNMIEFQDIPYLESIKLDLEKMFPNTEEEIE